MKVLCLSMVPKDYAITIGSYFKVVTQWVAHSSSNFNPANELLILASLQVDLQDSNVKTMNINIRNKMNPLPTQRWQEKKFLTP